MPLFYDNFGKCIPIILIISIQLTIIDFTDDCSFLSYYQSMSDLPIGMTSTSLASTMTVLYPVLQANNSKFR